MKKPLIPFGWMPGHWGLKGSTRDVAKAEYELSGVDLELRLAEIRAGNEQELERQTAEILHRHGKISDEDLERRNTDLADFSDENEKALANLAIDLKHGKITQDQHDRRKADILGEPWVSMPRIHWNPLGKARAYFELEYNDHFIKQLRETGYAGEDEELVSQWMNDVCISILEEINGMDADLATVTRRGGAVEHDDQPGGMHPRSIS